MSSSIGRAMIKMEAVLQFSVILGYSQWKLVNYLICSIHRGL